jgi:hypothetical protein
MTGFIILLLALAALTVSYRQKKSGQIRLAEKLIHDYSNELEKENAASLLAFEEASSEAAYKEKK